MRDMSVQFAGLTLKNPVVTASGSFGFGREYGEVYDLGLLGGICVKGLTLHPREGNPASRIAETPSGMLNSVGLQNPGINAFIEYELPWLRQFDTRIIANISGNTAEEYAELASRLDKSGVDMIELNISCPNVKAGGMAFGTLPESAAEATRAAREATDLPLMVKLSPNVLDIVDIALAAEEAGADALSLINTLLGMRIDIDTRRPVLRNNTGGLSGPAVHPIAVRMIWQVSRAVKIPILGMGGVSSGRDAVELMLAGAGAVAVGTANFVNPKAPLDILRGIEEYMEKHGIGSVSELTGAVREW